MTPLTNTGLALRGLSSVRGGFVLLGIVVMLAAASVTAWPRVTTAILTADLQHSVSVSGANTRDLQATVTPDLSQFTGEPLLAPTWRALPKALTSARAAMPSALRSVTGPGAFAGRAEGVNESGPAAHGLPASGPPDAASNASYYLSFEGYPALRSDATLTAGAWPTRAPAVPGDRPLEVVTTTEAAKTLGWTVGQTETVMLPDTSSQIVLLSGTVDPREVNADFWQLDRARQRAGITHSADLSTITYNAIVWTDVATWTHTAPALGGVSTTAWFPIVGSRFQVGELSAIATDLQRFLATPQPVTGGELPTTLPLGTGLPSVLDGYLARAVPANTLMAIFATGPFGTVFAAMVVVLRLMAARRRAAFALIYARGASPRQVRLRFALDAAVVTVPAALLGAAAAIVLVPGAPSAIALVGFAACAFVPPFVAAASIDPGGQGGLLGRKRWIIEVMVLALAALSVGLLAQHRASTSASGFTPDPVLVLAPLLVASAACVVVLRVFPAILGRLGVVLRRSRVGYIGWATSARPRAGGIWPLFAVIVGVSVAVFSLTVLTTERSGVRDAAILTARSDVTVTTLTSITAAQLARIDRIDGVAAVAPIRFAGPSRFDGATGNVDVYLADPVRVAATQTDLPAGIRPFARLGEHSGGGPVSLVGGLDRPATEVTAVMAHRDLSLRLSTVTLTTGAFLDNSPWVMLDSRAELGRTLTGPVQAVFLGLDAGADSAVVSRAIRGIVGTGAVVTAAEESAVGIRTTPLVTGMELVTIAALLLSALFCVAVFVLTLAMNAKDRMRLLARLRALGFDRRQSAGLVGWELGPITVVGLVAGTIVGLALAGLVLASVDLADFTGGDAPPLVSVDPLLLAAAVLGFVAAAALATLLSIALARRAPAAAVLREGEET